MNEENTLVLDQETMNKMVDDACKYIYNLMDYEGEYTPEAFTEKINGLKREDIFTIYKPLDMQTDLVTITQGYGNCGKEFIKNLIDKDKASAYHVFESVVQDWMDLQEFLRSVTEKLDSETNKLKAMKETSEKED